MSTALIIPDFPKYEAKLQVKVALLSVLETAEDCILSLEGTDVPIAVKEFAIAPDQQIRTATKAFPLSLMPATLPKLLNSSLVLKAKISGQVQAAVQLARLFYGECSASAVCEVSGKYQVSVSSETPILKEQILQNAIPVLLEISKLKFPVTLEVRDGQKFPIAPPIAAHSTTDVLVLVEKKKAKDFFLGDSLVFKSETGSTNWVKLETLLYEKSVEFEAEIFPGERSGRVQSPELDVRLSVRPQKTEIRSSPEICTFIKGRATVKGEWKTGEEEERVHRVAYVGTGERAREIEKSIDGKLASGFVLRFHKPSRVIFVVESRNADLVGKIASDLTYEKSGKVLYHPQCYWSEALYSGVRVIRVRRACISLEMIDFFLANSIFQLRDKFPSKAELDELETLKGEAPSLSPEKKKKLSRQEKGALAVENVKKLKAQEIYRERDFGREFEARMRSNALNAPFNVVNGTYVPRLKDAAGLVRTSALDKCIDRTPAPWRHLGNKNELHPEFVDVHDFHIYTQDGKPSLVRRGEGTSTGHADLWR